MTNKSTLIICCGMNRSGSTWSYQVCQELLLNKNSIDLGFVLPEELENVLQTKPSTQDYILAKMHVYSDYLKTITNQYNLKFVYTHRDLRGCIYSIMKKNGKTLNDVISYPFMIDAIESLPSWSSFKDVLFVNYIDIINNNPEVIKSMANLLSVRNIQENVIVSKFSRDMQLQRLSKFSKTPKGIVGNILTTLRLRPFVKDEESLLHNNHFNSLKSDEWKDGLTVRESDMIKYRFQDWMNFFSYD